MHNLVMIVVLLIIAAFGAWMTAKCRHTVGQKYNRRASDIPGK